MLQPGGLLLLHTGGPAPLTAWLRALVRGANELWLSAPGGPTGRTRPVDRMGWTDAVPGFTVVTAVRAVQPPVDLHLDVPAVAAELAPLRAALTTWLEELGATAEIVTAVPLVVSELVSNVVEHAYPGDEPGRVRVDASIDGPAGLLASVSDDGRWVSGGLRPGYGLAVARELADSLIVQASGNGTRVDATFTPGRPTVVHPAGARVRLRPAVSGRFEVSEPGDGASVVTVRGPLELPVVDDLRSVLLHSSGGGTGPVVLDLTGATAVATAGVRLLYELSRFGDPPLRVRAPAGSVAHGVLTLAGLGRLLDGPR